MSLIENYSTDRFFLYRDILVFKWVIYFSRFPYHVQGTVGGMALKYGCISEILGVGGNGPRFKEVQTNEKYNLLIFITT